jgi:hypothetical protein
MKRKKSTAKLELSRETVGELTSGTYPPRLASEVYTTCVTLNNCPIPMSNVCY